VGGEHWLAALVAFGFAGFGLGVGLMVGAHAVRRLRRYIREDDDK
jgi:hypothetical protein